MDVTSLRRLEPSSMHYASKPSAPNPSYLNNFVSKPLVCRPQLHFTQKSKAFASPKLKILSELLENEALTGTNSEKTIDAAPLTKVNGKLNHVNGGPHVIKTNMKVNGNGGMTSEQCFTDQVRSKLQGDKALEILPQAHISVNDKVEEVGYQQAWATSIMPDANRSDYISLMQALYMRDHPPKEGLGIVEFLKGKNLFITGATGFLAKVLVEKILRVQPDVGHIFLLIKGKDMHHATKRLQDEILESQLFNTLKSFYGDKYQQFMERKLIPIVGNIALDNLGMDIDTMEELQRKLDIVINSAASTTFDERYDHALNLNTKGAQRIAKFGRSCLHLQLLMHVSTAFVNGKRKGVVAEKTFKIGYSIANEVSNSNEGVTQDINVENELRAIQTRMAKILNKDQSGGNLHTPQLNDQQREKKLQEAMKELGMERAKKFGWQDTYVFTKAMGEMLVDSTRGQVPVVIVRPSVVESSFKDPFPGWMEGNRMMDPVILSYGKGQLPGFLADPKSVLDVVPVDMVANAMLAAMARHAGTPRLEVYQVASSVVNPLSFSKLAQISGEYFVEHPFMDMDGKPLKPLNAQLFQDMDSFMDAFTFCSHSTKEKTPSTSVAQSLLNRRSQLALKIKQQAASLANLYQPYTFYAGRFDNSKTQHLYSSLSEQEKEVFGFNVSEIDWETYIKSIHIPGLRKHVLKGRGSNM